MMHLGKLGSESKSLHPKPHMVGFPYIAVP